MYKTTCGTSSLWSIISVIIHLEWETGINFTVWSMLLTSMQLANQNGTYLKAEILPVKKKQSRGPRVAQIAVDVKADNTYYACFLFSDALVMLFR